MASVSPSELPSQQLQQDLYRTLQGTLAPEHEVRSRAESTLSQHLDSEPYIGLALVNILFFAPASDPLSLPIRQSAAVILQKYIQQSWSPVHPQFRGQQYMVQDEVKAEIRRMLLHGLPLEERKLRTACAFAISTIAQSDYPDSYPALLPTLMHYLSAGLAAQQQQQQGSTAGIAVHGAMRVLSEFVRQELAETEMIGMMREIGPLLLDILRSPLSDAGSRVSAVGIFRNCVRTLYIIKDENPDAANNAVAMILPTWLETLRELVRGELTQTEALARGQGWETMGIAAEVFRTFSTVQSCFPRAITPSLADYINYSTRYLHEIYPVFQQYYIATGDSALEPPSSNSDDDVESGIPDVASAALDFLTAVSRARAKKVFVQTSSSSTPAKEEGTPVHVELVSLVLKYAQIKREEEDDWLGDANAFVADDDDEAESYGLRTSGFDLLGSLLDLYQATAARVLEQATKQRMREADDLRSRNEGDWWKALEATLAAVGSVADSLLDMQDEEQATGIVESFDLDNLFKNVLPQLLNMTDLPFLQGRAFVFASQYVLALESAGMADQYLDAAMQALQADAVGLPVKICAIKTIRNFCRYMPAEQLSTRSLQIVALLVPFLQQATEESLALVMETIRAVIGVDSGVLTPDASRELLLIVLQVWRDNAEDPLFTAIVEETLETMAASPAAYESIVRDAVPTLAEIIRQPADEDNISLPASALELIEAVLRGRKGPLGDSFGPALWPSLFETLATTEDNDTLQHGCTALTLFVRKDCQALITWQSLDGHSGLQKMLSVIAQLVRPGSNESSGLFVGDLILHLLRNAGAHLNDVLPDLLRALTIRIATASSGLFVQTLALPFAYLFYVAKDVTLNLLDQIQADDGTGLTVNGLDIVLRGWCDEGVSTVQGSYSIKVNNLAMANLLSEPSLNRVMVKGDLIIDDDNRNTIMTRSKTKSRPDAYAQVPFPVRALKYLLSEIQSAEVRADENAKFGDLGLEEDDGDEDWENDDPFDAANEAGGKDEMAFLADLMGGNMKAFQEEGLGGSEEDDEDLMNDPITQIDIQSNIAHTLRQAYAQNTNNIHDMIPQLNDVEKAVMQRVLTL